MVLRCSGSLFMPGMDGVRAGVGPGMYRCVPGIEYSTPIRISYGYGIRDPCDMEKKLICCTIPIPKMKKEKIIIDTLMSWKTKQNNIKPTLAWTSGSCMTYRHKYNQIHMPYWYPKMWNPDWLGWIWGLSNVCLHSNIRSWMSWLVCVE